MLSWMHFGDLHAAGDDRYESLERLRSMVRLVNRHLSDRVDFVPIPGDSANKGTPEQFHRIFDEVSALKLPRHAIPGDRESEPGSLDAFNAFANAPLPMSRVLNGHRCIFLDVVSDGLGGADFRLLDPHRQWLERELASSAQDPEPPVAFMHACPGDVADGQALAGAFARANVVMVDTGHTHYNELLNDGFVIYAATRSTGQIEEDNGRPGFSVAAVNGAVVSWKLHPFDAAWPFVMITRASDSRRQRSRSTQDGSDKQCIRVLVSDDGIVSVTGNLDGIPIGFSPGGGEAGIRQATLRAATASDRMPLTVTARTADGRSAEGSVSLQAAGHMAPHPERHCTPGTGAHAVGPWPEHGIAGSQPGPNRNGHHW
jgi:3',5'-cyclic-AMP phosphodiesterase